jgi:hypothetical protein
MKETHINRIRGKLFSQATCQTMDTFSGSSNQHHIGIFGNDLEEN